MLKKQKKNKIFVYILIAFMILVSVAPCVEVNAAETGCYFITKPLTEASIKYMDEIYIRKYPAFGLEQLYGSAEDQLAVKQAAEIIVSKKKTSKTKVESIVRWVNSNINYNGTIMQMIEVAQYPAEVLREREANCVGYAMLMSRMMRSIGIPTVMCTGYYGDMNVYTVNKIENDTSILGHAWIFVYYDNIWHLYDPLSGVMDMTDTEQIARHYFIDSVEGVIPSYEGIHIDDTLLKSGNFYENGKFYNYFDGKKSDSDYTKMVNFMLVNFRNLGQKKNANDGMSYVVDPDRKNQMEDYECYRDGWLKYGSEINRYTYPNGIMATHTFLEYQGKQLYMNNFGMIEILPENTPLIKSYPAMTVGSSIYIEPYVLQAAVEEGCQIEWKVQNENSKDIVSVDSNGVIYAKKTGLATVEVCGINSMGGYRFSHSITVRVVDNIKPIVMPEVRDTDVDVLYHTHIQSFGDSQGTKRNGEMAGTSGMAKRLENIWIRVDGNDDLGIQYSTHCQSYGWLPWSSNGEINGTSGEAKRLEAIKIQLTGKDKDNYDIYYRVHAQSYGWLGWAKNGECAGTAGLAKRLEGIQIVIKNKGQAAPGLDYMDVKVSATKYNEQPYISTIVGTVSIPGSAVGTNVMYKTHVQTYGWQAWRLNGAMSGTSGKAKRLEGINVKLSNAAYSGGIEYRTHIQKNGWEQNWKKDGEMSGTSGEAKRLEAIQIRLYGEMAEKYDVYYRVHAQTYGWLGWAKNGQSSGTARLAKRLEGIQIVIVPKGENPPENTYLNIASVTSKAFIEP